MVWYVLMVISMCLLMYYATSTSVRRLRARRDDKLSRQSEAFAARDRAAELVLQAPADAELMRRFTEARAGLSDGQCLKYDKELQEIRDEYGDVMGLYVATAEHAVIVQDA